MKTMLRIYNNYQVREACACWRQSKLGLGRLAFAATALLIGGLLSSPLQAQTVVIAPETLNYWAGINTSAALGVGSNSVTMTGANGTATINFAVSGQPAGLTTVLSTNSCTNSIQLGLFLSATNIAAGTYPLTLSGSGAASYSTNVNLFVVPEWSQTNGGSTGNWSDSTKWSSGATPAATDAIYFEHMITAPFTNVVDISQTNQSLVYLGDADDASYANAVNTTINSGVTLSIFGTNGFYLGRKNVTGARPFYTFSGAGALVVTNAAANFGVIDGNANSTRYLTVNMTNLNNLNAYVSRFAVGDTSLSTMQGVYHGAQMVNFFFPKTNVITALWTDNYNNVDFNTSIQYQRSDVAMNGAQTCGFNLGMTNDFYADSLGIGRGNNVGSGSSAFGILGYSLKFANVFSNSAAPFAGAYLRNTNGGRMSLLALGVDSGASTSIGNNRGMADFRGGRVDMLVNQVWLGQNRTNCAAKDDQGGLYFDWGTINANTVVAGNMKYTNIVSAIAGYVLVGTNGTLFVNTNLVLGLTPTNVTGFAAQAAAVSGQVQINNGGAIRASQISVGQFSTNNVVTINNGGILDVTNNIASASTMLSVLTAAGGGLTLHVSGNNTLVYVSNLTASVSSPINIASISGISSFPVTLHLISYANATTPNNWVGGTGPAGLTVGVANNGGNNSIDVTLSTGTPKALLWKGYVDNNWDLSTPNWLDLNTGLHTNFATLDYVAFDDTASTSTINISGDVVPSQAAGGIQMTNNSLNYTFTGSGRILGGATLGMFGANSLTVDLYAEFGAKVNQGNLTVTANGTIGSAAIASGSSFSNNGTVLGSVTSSGIANNANVIIGNLAVQASGIATNMGTINGTLSMQTNSLVYNAGTLTAIGTPTVATNAILINAGTIYGSTLTVALGGTLVDTVQGSAGVSAGSINIGTLTVNGEFEPGGSTIATTKITDYDYSSSGQLGYPNGRVQLSAGSVTTLQINTANSPQNTEILSQNQGFGPSQGSKAFNGCTLLITNLGPALTAGETFQFFGAYYTGGNTGNAGLNATNSYPIIQPSTPGPGLAWDLSQLIPQGIIGVLSASDPSLNFTLTNTTTVYPATTNIITQLSWPTDQMGGWLQQLNTTLTNGLSATNWVSLNGNYGNTNIGIQIMSNTNVWLITNTLVTDPTAPGSAVFFRFVYP
jgi:hypothetical protein